MLINYEDSHILNESAGGSLNLKRSFSVSDNSPFGFNKKARSSCEGTPFSFSSPTASFVGEFSMLSPRAGRKLSRSSSIFSPEAEDSLDSFPSISSQDSKESSFMMHKEITVPSIPLNPPLVTFFSIAFDNSSNFDIGRACDFDGAVEDELAKELVDRLDLAGEFENSQNVATGREVILNIVASSATPALASLFI